MCRPPSIPYEAQTKVPLRDLLEPVVRCEGG